MCDSVPIWLDFDHTHMDTHEHMRTTVLLPVSCYFMDWQMVKVMCLEKAPRQIACKYVCSCRFKNLPKKKKV